jgi:hypothetical protein
MTESSCPNCERYKLSASMWRHEAYKHAGTELPWDPEVLLQQEYERGFFEGLRSAKGWRKRQIQQEKLNDNTR